MFDVLLELMRLYYAVINALLQDKHTINSMQMTIVLEKICKFVD